ncbi:MAG: site-specific integrase [Gammaproteobacteria bacterium]|nr:site-specific integrase [Gammaproteobacteria bacterium]
MAKITKRLVDSTKPGASRLYVWDEVIPGFALVVQTTGKKSYAYQYRDPAGHTRRATIGRHGAYTPDEARDKAKEYQRAVNEGRDPLAEKEGRRQAVTVGKLLDLYLESAAFAEKAESTQGSDRGRVNRHLKPLLGRKVADQLKPDDIRKAFAAIKAGKTATTEKTGLRGLARVRGGEGAARMSIRLLKSVYGWAIKEGMLTENPATGIAIGKDGRRDLVLTLDQYPALFAAIDALEAEFKVSRAAAAAIRVIALTGARRGEIAGLRWRHVKLKEGLAELPAESHKTGRKTGETRTIGLPSAAAAIISQQPEGKADDLVFRPAKGKGVINLAKPWTVIRKEAGLNPSLGLHGLRHSLATGMAESGSQAAHIMAVLGHRDIATSQRYVHMAQDVRTRLAEKAASGISAALEGRKAADVVPIQTEGHSDA